MAMDVREKLVELLNEVQETGVNEIPAGFGYTSEYVSNKTVASHLIANGVTVQKWISVKDRLPKETGRYLVVKKRIAPDNLGGNSTDIVILRFSVDDGFKMPAHIPDWINKKINEEVTHWMPLPQLPKGE